MSLEEGLLKQLIDQNGEILRTLGDHGQAISSLRNELIGPSGKNGRLGKIEAEVEVLKAERQRFKGARVALHYIITVGSSIIAFFGLHKFFK